MYKSNCYFLIKRILTPLVILYSFSLSGCVDIGYHPYVEVIEAHATTPSGSLPMVRKSSIHPNKYSSTADTTIYGKNKNLIADFNGLGSTGHVSLTMNTQTDFYFTGDIAYKNNGVDKGLLNIGYSEETDLDILLHFEPPEPLRSYTNTSTRGYSKPTAKRVMAHDNDIYRFIIPYVVNGEDQVIDVSFKMKVKRSYSLAVPGVISP